MKFAIFLFKKKIVFLNAGIKTATGGRWKLVKIDKISVRKIFIIGKNPDRNEDKMKENIYLVKSNDIKLMTR